MVVTRDMIRHTDDGIAPLGRLTFGDGELPAEKWDGIGARTSELTAPPWRRFRCLTDSFLATFVL